jgi:hypothetical protein
VEGGGGGGGPGLGLMAFLDGWGRADGGYGFFLLLANSWDWQNWILGFRAEIFDEIRKDKI